MKKLDLPECGEMEIFDQSVAAISDIKIKRKFINDRAEVVSCVMQFYQSSINKKWSDIGRASHGNAEQLITTKLSKKELSNLYTKHVAAAKGAARKFYDDILVQAKGRCPYCSGVGEATTLDHFLPKSGFPVFSVLPVNLVPSCKDCNVGKHAAFPTDENLQPIHPYFDHDHFFTEKWITAEILRTDPIIVEFKVSAPAHWSNKDKSRVNQHFQDYKLCERYALQVWDELATVINQRKNTLRELGSAQYRKHLLDGANTDSLQINGWKRTLYSALANTAWFYSADFSTPNGHMLLP